MGQRAVGIFYGIEVPSIEQGGPLLYGADAEPERPGEGLMERWERLSAKRRGKRQILTIETGGVFLLGCWVAVCGDVDEHPGAQSIEGEAYALEALAQLKTAASAHVAWERFAAWAISHGGDFVEPELWLVPTEVA